MRPIVFVTQTVDPEDAGRPFAVAHVRALADRGARLVVVSDNARCNPADLRATVIPLRGPSFAGRHAELDLDSVLRDLVREIPEALTIVDGSLDALERVARALTSRASTVLWWCNKMPHQSAIDRAKDLAHGILTVVPEPATSAAMPSWTIGAGVDTAVFLAEPMPEQPPFRLVTLARGPSDVGLPLLVHALASVRGQGIDARLTVLALPREAPGPDRRHQLESLASDLVVGHALDFCDTVPGSKVPDLLAGYHVVIDAGAQVDPSRFSLEAMSSGHVAVSSNAALSPLLDLSSMQLRFDPTDVSSLAEVIVGLGRAWPAELEQIGGVLRAGVEARHSALTWANKIVTLAEHVDDWRHFNPRLWMRTLRPTAWRGEE